MTVTASPPLATLIPWLQQQAGPSDEAAAFPSEALAALRHAGVLTLPLPIEDAEMAADRFARMLMQLGQGNLSVGRLVEAHVNARHLIARYGTAAQRARAIADTQDGHLFGLWVTDPPEGGLRIIRAHTGIQLAGSKMFCSGAGHVTRALVTATDESGGAQMLVLPLGQGERVQPLEAPLQGMRSAVTGGIDFTGCIVPAGSELGVPGDYLREPDLSCGAWRSSAVAAGGLRSLLDLAITQLRALARLDDAHQLQRVGMVMVACETSRLWVMRAARLAENPHADAAEAIAYVGLARIAVEAACLDAMQLIQRSLGLAAFRRGNPIERICRDLATYLRQPAPDAVLTEAAAHFARQPLALP